MILISDKNMNIHRFIIQVIMLLVITINGKGQMKKEKQTVNKPKTVSDAVAIVSPCIVRVKTEFSTQNNSQRQTGAGKGTGFIVSKDGYVATALHVVTPPMNWQLNRVSIGFPTPNVAGPTMIVGNFIEIDAEVVEEDQSHDLVLLKLKQNPIITGLGPGVKINNKVIPPNKIDVGKLDPNMPHDGLQIIVSGYPLANSVLVTSVGYLAASWGIDSKEVSVAGIKQSETIGIYLGDITINGGNSGGPVYSAERGFVIGVAVAQQLAQASFRDVDGQVKPLVINQLPILYSSGIAHIIPIKYVIDLLEKHKVTHLKLPLK